LKRKPKPISKIKAMIHANGIPKRVEIKLVTAAIFKERSAVHPNLRKPIKASISMTGTSKSHAAGQTKAIIGTPISAEATAGIKIVKRNKI
jgi:hypothetical protein